jgi:hypothetical protein
MSGVSNDVVKYFSMTVVMIHRLDLFRDHHNDAQRTAQSCLFAGDALHGD